MKKYTFLAFLLLLNLFTKAQNLIQNSDFESYSTCPTFHSQVDKLNQWFSTVYSPDYYNCSFTSLPDFPTVSLAYSGTGFTGFLSYGDANGSGEAIAQHLNQPLIPNATYAISFFAKRPYMDMYANDCAGLEVYGFIDSIPTDTSFVHTSQIPYAILLGATPVIQDTGWTAHTINFTVADTINYMVFTIGQAPSCLEYIFLDSINLINTTPSSIAETDYNDPFNVYPNPSKGLFTLSLPGNSSEIIITNMLGQVVENISTQEKTIDLTINKNGIYFVSVKSQQGTIVRKLVISK